MVTVEDSVRISGDAVENLLKTRDELLSNVLGRFNCNRDVFKTSFIETTVPLSLSIGVCAQGLDFLIYAAMEPGKEYASLTEAIYENILLAQSYYLNTLHISPYVMRQPV